MLPNPPPRRIQHGFLYLPPFRVQGLSIAGEETVVQVPELDVCFDIGRCPRLAVASKYVALSHGHMDHSAGLAYYFSQRYFQGMEIGTVFCHPDLEKPIHKLMRAWVDLEAQRSPYRVVPLAPDSETEIKNNVHLRAFATAHTVPSLGYVAIERRSKLRPDLVGLPQEQLIELKNKGQDITRTVEIPLVCFTGDTAASPHFDRPDVLEAKVLITECTFIEPGHRSRAEIGKHLHLDDIIDLLDRCQAEAVVITHLSRRTHVATARDHMNRLIPAKHRDRVFLLMDGKTNRLRLESQVRQTQVEEISGGPATVET